MDEFYETLRKIREYIEGKVIAIPGHNPIGRVVRVDEMGAWLEGKGAGRITIEGLVFYHPVYESRINNSKSLQARGSTNL